MKDVDLIALAGLLHDIGKFGQRAGLSEDEDNLDLYCPFRKDEGYFTHKHALYTGQIIDEIEKRGLFKKQDLDNFPFCEDDSFINAAAMHHKPNTLLQWIIAIADRVSSGFERETFNDYNQSDEKKNYLQARLHNSFGDFEKRENEYRYKLQKISSTISTDIKEKVEPQNNDEAKKEYKQLYDDFLNDLKKIKQGNIVEKIDSLLEVYTTFIPSATAFGTKPNVSLYDHLKSTSAFAVALYKYHKKDLKEKIDINTKEEWKKKKFLIISGDFFGIQKFIFSSSVENNKSLAKTLRGKSAMVSIITELATLKIIQELELSSTSILQNVAGKFMIVADNTEETRKKLKKVKEELNEWFLKYTYGESGIGIAEVEASCEDFSHKKLSELQKIIHFKIEDIKSNKFNLLEFENVIFEHYLENLKDKELCKSCNIRAKEIEDLCSLCNHYKELGAKLANSKNDKIYIYKKEDEEFDIFGYVIKYKYLNKKYEAVYDFSLPNEKGEIFTGYPKRTFKSYIPTKIDDEHIEIPKTFEEIAKSATGKEALAVFKADIDNLGAIFIEKLPSIGEVSFAKYNMVSRLINNFFTINLQYFLKNNFKNIYTVFAGGDDLFLIGAWSEVFEFAKEFKKLFDKYFITVKSGLSYSASITMVKPSTPVGYQARVSEEELEEAKKLPNKNGVRVFNNSVNYKQFLELIDISNDFDSRVEDFNLSHSFIYALMELSEMKDNEENIENTLWRSKLRYIGYRNIVEKAKKEKKKEAQDLIIQIGDEINKYKNAYKIALYTHLYKERSNVSK